MTLGSQTLSLFNELKRRNVFRVAAAYIIVGWLLLQVSDTLVPALRLPDWFHSGVAFLLIMGFPVALIFAWAFEMTPEGIRKEKDVERSQSITRITGRKLDFTIIGLLALTLAYMAIDKFLLAPDRAAEPQASAISSPAEPAVVPEEEKASQNSIAVLPFVNMSDDAGNEYFSDGISEEILNALAGVEDLKVAGRTSSFTFKGRNEDLRTIGEALGVSHILEGSVRKAGMQVRITAQLIKADDGFHLWSETYDRELTDIFAIQDEIAQAIFDQLKVHLTGEPGEMQFTFSSADPEAFDLYLEAKQKTYSRERAALQESATLLERAIVLDPGYAPAHAQLAITTLLLSERVYGTIPWQESLDKAEAALDQALSLDPESAEVWTGRGLYLYRLGEYQEAVAALRRALAINPSLVDARQWLANSLNRLGELDESFRARKEVLVRDPLYLPGINMLLDDYFLFGEIEEATELMDRVRPYLPAERTLTHFDGVLLFHAGRVAESLPYFDAYIEMSPDSQIVKGSFSRALLYAWQNERLAEEGQYEYRVYAMMRLGRNEEAEELAWDLAENENSVAALFRLLVEQRRCSELIEYLESRWPDLAAFETDYPERDGWSEHNYLGQISYCYRRLGDETKFQDALSRFEAALKYQRGLGANNHWFLFAEAVHAVLAGDNETALSKLEKSLEGGFTVDPQLSKTWPMFEPLDGDPRLQAILDRMVEHLNAERAKMGLEPI
jgi:TolB-like protein/tetratricopeptide (TPR) repeat protein